MVYYFAFLCLAIIANAAVSPKSLDSDISILIHNDLIETESPLSGSGILVLDARSWQEATDSCQKLGESLWGTNSSYRDIQSDLDYLVFQGKYTRDQRFWTTLDHRKLSTIDTTGRVNKASADEELPVLCTQSAPFSNSTFQNTSAQWQVTVHSNDEYLTGFRDRFSFRFLGIRYAQQPRQWDYSQVYQGTGKKASALDYGSDCTQGTTGSEDCLFLNVWTPYLPKSTKIQKSHLKPVMLWIHGGAFTGGTGSDPTFDGGNLASRGDVVVVTINYRLGTLGFLALDDGETNGNYGLADQTTALEWVRRNIQDFGGDPDRVTIFGQSAGAASVRALLASPAARGKFAGAIMQSNLGGLAYGTTYSKYYTIAQAMDVVGNSILNETNCTDAASPVECLRQLPVSTIANLADSARYLVVDGVYLRSSELDLTNSSSTANVPLMIGTMRDDGAAMIGYPASGQTLKSFLNESGLPDSVAPSKLFPMPSTANSTLDIFNTSSRIATDGMFRCIDEATAHTGSRTHIFPDIYYYEFNRSYQMPGWSPNAPVCNAPITDEFPNGDPREEYFKCHSGELFYVFGSFRRQGLPFRDEFDLPFGQYVLDSWASFARAAKPTPDLAFLKARGYDNTTREIELAGIWEPFGKESQLRLLQWPSKMRDLDELEQCRALKLSLDYFNS
ncbi:hypothetical protein N7536_005115 [Penicillium majusculum]|uniref:Carboxylic ester hydrolase n=1 Tax=Penicillium solitum TaxID=60172 RepID=A0A1V6QAZ7_9EURO|nr:uncharacterized protein PENSOL_c089G11964 [Penicillium solitum]KAJ5694703.1 hypothetical protein N7536_005115 [Penicillium majusculum]OQD86399.1 hypothetical protein PENSOL_c089G11964 [Penicillium solitum]